MFWNVSVKQMVWRYMKGTVSVISKLFPSVFAMALAEGETLALREAEEVQAGAGAVGQREAWEGGENPQNREWGDCLKMRTRAPGCFAKGYRTEAFKS